MTFVSPAPPRQPRNKLEQAFVVTFGRAGEDNKSFKLTNIESTLAGFAGADYDLQASMAPLAGFRSSPVPGLVRTRPTLSDLPSSARRSGVPLTHSRWRWRGSSTSCTSLAPPEARRPQLSPQDALTTLTDKRSSEHEIDGQKYYDVEIVSPDIRYLMTFTVNLGKVYAFLVKSPTKVRLCSGTMAARMGAAVCIAMGDLDASLNLVQTAVPPSAQTTAAVGESRAVPASHPLLFQDCVEQRRAMGVAEPTVEPCTLRCLPTGTREIRECEDSEN